MVSLDFGLDLTAAYTYIDSEITKSEEGDEGNRASNVSEHQASLLVKNALKSGALEGLGFGGGVRYVGEVFGTNANTSDLEIPSHTLFDAVLDYEWGGFELALNATNLFDKEFVVTCSDEGACFLGEGRAVIGSVSYRFD